MSISLFYHQFFSVCFPAVQPLDMAFGKYRKISDRWSRVLSRFHQDELMRHQEVTLTVEFQCCWCVVAGFLDCCLLLVAQELRDIQQKKSSEKQLEERKGRIGSKVFQG